jgi:starch synthase (maltosyl-transferring)
VDITAPLQKIAARPRICVENVYPAVDDGRHAVKRIVGEPIEVWADIFRDGHEPIAAQLRWRREGSGQSDTVPFVLHGNDRWLAAFTPTEPGIHSFAIEAWTDRYGSWAHDLKARQAAGQDVTQDLEEGRLLLREGRIKTGPQDDLLSDAMMQKAAEALPLADHFTSQEYKITVDRLRARFGSWYEMVPRSQGSVPGKGATFDDCIARLPDIAALRFDVIYLTPIHPIGRINRKGKNNALKGGPGDPGSFYAIGAKEGGHDAVHPELGGLPAFRRFVKACREHQMEVALDFAVQCAPDHPWLKEHPEWFKYRPDGSIRYAENPPKKYEDIVNVDFYCEQWQALWRALRDVVLFWVNEGVKIFRVDNPHTKPLPFWEWMIAEVKRVDPDVLFLSEAFTRPKLMLNLAKLGFTQSYTYFTWRTTKAEQQEYLSELSAWPTREFFNPNFFVTTPDILPVQLQKGDVWLFKARVALAAMLSSSYGIYNGFELVEYEPLPGKEEYLNSEKYEIKVRNWNQPGNIKDYIANLNRLRRQNPALQQTFKLNFLQVDHDDTLGFLKHSIDGEETLAIAIAVSKPDQREFWLHFGDNEIGPPNARRRIVAVENLATGERHSVQWGGVRLRLDPNRDPMIALRCV